MRSRIEIAAALEAMRADGAVLMANLPDEELLFMSRLLRVEAARQAIVIACTESKAANLALLECRSVGFNCNHRGVHHEFVAANPREATLSGKPALRLDFPRSLLVAQRRAQPRYEVPARVPLRCVVDWGPVSFDARVVDISRAGIGTIVYDAGIRIEPGTRLPRARIQHPKRAVLVGLEVRNVRKVVLRDGSPAMRAGCRFIGARHDVTDLIRLFVTELED